jgi:hypothetical protein
MLYVSLATKAVSWVLVIFFVMVTFGATAEMTACGESAGCSRLRSTMYDQKLVWGACDPADPFACIKVAGNTLDCTGVLACDFAVAPKFREAAEQAVLTIGEQSQGCYLCAKPGCVSGDTAYCEAVTRQCLLATSTLTSLIDAGPLPRAPVDSAGGLSVVEAGPSTD